MQFYSKFLPPYFLEITEPLYKLKRKGQQWKWGEVEATSFKKIKRLLCTETVLAHYDPSLPLGLSCDASECGIGAVLFHRFADGSERPILNISKILSATQRRYSQIQKEALSLVYALKKFHQFLYGRKFIVVTTTRWNTVEARTIAMPMLLVACHFQMTQVLMGRRWKMMSIAFV